jgi:quinol monooxygenase YgiN
LTRQKSHAAEHGVLQKLGEQKERVIEKRSFELHLLVKINYKNEMVGGLKIVQVKPGHEAELERLFAGLRSEMWAHEPDCRLYSLLKSRAKPGAYIVHEQYRDQAALDFHQKSAHSARYFPLMRAIIEKIEVEYFDGVVD